MIYVLNPNLSPEDIDASVQMVETLITELKGSSVQSEKMGRKDLQSIFNKNKKLTNGFFCLTRFEFDPVNLPEFNRKLKLKEEILRAMIVTDEEKPVEEAVVG